MITVQGEIKRPNGAPFEGNLILYPLSTPLIVSTSAIHTAPVVIATDETGSFETELAAGEYDVDCVISRVRQNPVRRYRIRVPNSVNGDYNATVRFDQCVLDGINEPQFFGGLPGGSVSITVNDTSGVGYEGAAGLRARTVHANNQLAYIFWALSDGDGGAGFFRYVSANTDADDGINTIKPTDVSSGNPGRWKRVS